jgi:hypothetical protein
MMNYNINHHLNDNHKYFQLLIQFHTYLLKI